MASPVMRAIRESRRRMKGLIPGLGTCVTTGDSLSSLQLERDGIGTARIKQLGAPYFLLLVATGV